MELLDIVFAPSDSAVLELTGVNSSIADIVFNAPALLEVAGANGSANDIVFNTPAANEIPAVLITDFAFI
jgi:hypothetical protein